MLLIFALFIASTAIQLCYYLFVFSRFSSLKPTKKEEISIPISVLICARNESENLQQLLPEILQQNYPNFEIVLINDRSFDDSLEVMKSFKKKYPSKIKIVTIAETKNGGSKKHALSLGIKAATHEHLLFTDADCIPNSKNWIYEMSQHFTAKKSIVLGYGGHRTIKKSWLNKLIRFETLMTAMQYISYANIGFPYMGVGRNLAYTKSLFFDNNGFDNHLHLKSGDDDLFVNQNATKENISVSLHPDSFTISEPKTTFKDWINQKRRHISTANYYKPLHQFLLGLYFSSQLLFWILGVFLLAFGYQWKIVLGLFFVRTAIQYIIISSTSKKLNENGLVFWTPFLEIFLVLTQLFIFIKNLVSKPTHW